MPIDTGPEATKAKALMPPPSSVTAMTVHTAIKVEPGLDTPSTTPRSLGERDSSSQRERSPSVKSEPQARSGKWIPSRRACESLKQSTPSTGGAPRWPIPRAYLSSSASTGNSAFRARAISFLSNPPATPSSTTTAPTTPQTLNREPKGSATPGSFPHWPAPTDRSRSSSVSTDRSNADETPGWTRRGSVCSELSGDHPQRHTGGHVHSRPSKKARSRLARYGSTASAVSHTSTSADTLIGLDNGPNRNDGYTDARRKKAYPRVHNPSASLASEVPNARNPNLPDGFGHHAKILWDLFYSFADVVSIPRDDDFTNRRRDNLKKIAQRSVATLLPLADEEMRRAVADHLAVIQPTNAGQVFLALVALRNLMVHIFQAAVTDFGHKGKARPEYRMMDRVLREWWAAEGATLRSIVVHESVTITASTMADEVVPFLAFMWGKRHREEIYDTILDRPLRPATPIVLGDIGRLIIHTQSVLSAVVTAVWSSIPVPPGVQLIHQASQLQTKGGRETSPVSVESSSPEPKSESTLEDESEQCSRASSHTLGRSRLGTAISERSGISRAPSSSSRLSRPASERYFDL